MTLSTWHVVCGTVHLARFHGACYKVPWTLVLARDLCRASWACGTGHCARGTGYFALALDTVLWNEV